MLAPLCFTNESLEKEYEAMCSNTLCAASDKRYQYFSYVSIGCYILLGWAGIIEVPWIGILHAFGLITLNAGLAVAVQLSRHRTATIVVYKLLTAPFLISGLKSWTYLPPGTELSRLGFVKQLLVVSGIGVILPQTWGLPLLLKHQMLLQMVVVVIYNTLVTGQVCSSVISTGQGEAHTVTTWQASDIPFSQVLKYFLPVRSEKPPSAFCCCRCMVTVTHMLPGLMLPTYLTYVQEARSRLHFLRANPAANMERASPEDLRALESCALWARHLTYAALAVVWLACCWEIALVTCPDSR